MQEKLVYRKNIFDIYVTEYGTALTTILPILFLYLNTVTVTAGTFERNESGRFGAYNFSIIIYCQLVLVINICKYYK
jgi:hypothetical protein